MHASELRGRARARRREVALPLSSWLFRRRHRPARGGTAAPPVAPDPRARPQWHRGSLWPGKEPRMKRRFTREQRTTIVNGVLCVLLILVVLQLWLFTATMNAWL